jgi:hypothetical protein
MAFDDPSLGWLFTGDRIPDEPIVAWMSAPLRHAAVVAPSRPSGNEHVARYLVGTLAPLGIDLSFDDRPLAVTPIASDEILVHPGSGSPAKNWPPEQFAAVIRALKRPPRLIVGEADVGIPEEIEASLGRALPRLEQPPLQALAARLAGCRAYLGNDSGVSHLAGLCGARTVALFGPTNPDVWRPIGPYVHVVPFDADTESVVSRLIS